MAETSNNEVLVAVAYPGIATIVRRVLAREGYSVQVAGSLIEAMQLYEQQPAGTVMLDSRLPTSRIDPPAVDGDPKTAQMFVQFVRNCDSRPDGGMVLIDMSSLPSVHPGDLGIRPEDSIVLRHLDDTAGYTGLLEVIHS